MQTPNTLLPFRYIKKTYLKFTKTSFIFFVDVVLLNWASNVCQENQ